MKKQRLTNQAAEANADAASLVEEQPGWLLSQAREVGSAIIKAAGVERMGERAGTIAGISTGLGLAFAAIENDRGWQRPRAVDARIHTAMVFAMTEFPSDLGRLRPLLSFCLRGAYWVARAGTDGLAALIAQDGLGELVEERGLDEN